MKTLGVLCIWVVLVIGVLGVPFLPYEPPRLDPSALAQVGGAKLALKRGVPTGNVHREIARVQAVNRAYKKFAKRLSSPVKRDPYSEVLEKHNDLVKRGENPGDGHLIERKFGANGLPKPLLGNPPTVSPAVALDEDGDDITYFAAIGIGEQNKQFFVVMDSGSADLWVPAANCKSEACVVHNSLGSSDSSTLQATTQPWQIQYGTGAAAGVLVRDSIDIGGLSVTQMPFGVATQLTNNFAQFTPDGILGLALTQANSQGVPTVMDQLKLNNLISRKLIGVNLQRAADNNNDGEMSFGIIDTSKFQGLLTIVPNVSPTGLWEVSVDDISVNGQVLGFTNRTSITDTGTTLMLLPPADASALHEAIPGSVTDGQGNFGFPCSTNVDIAVIYSGNSFSISPKDYVGAPISGSGNICQSNIVGQQVGSETQWLLGDVFLKNVYTVFDYDNNQVGFGGKSSSGNSSTAAENNQSFLAASAASRPVPGSSRWTVAYGLGCAVLSVLFMI